MEGRWKRYGEDLDTYLGRSRMKIDEDFWIILYEEYAGYSLGTVSEGSIGEYKMRRFKRFYIFFKWIYYFGIAFLSICCLIVGSEILNGRMGMAETIWLFMSLIFYIVVIVGLARYYKKMIVYIKIEDGQVQIYDFYKRKHEVSMVQIERIIITGSRYLFVLKNGETLFAYRQIWKPFVEKDGVRHEDILRTGHEDILRTDFIGVRIDEDFSRV